MNMETTRQEVSLEEVTQRKEELLNEIRTQKEVIRTRTSDLFAPVRPASRAGNIMHSINSSIAVIDGIIIGMKVIKRIRRTFHK